GAGAEQFQIGVGLLELLAGDGNGLAAAEQFFLADGLAGVDGLGALELVLLIGEVGLGLAPLGDEGRHLFLARHLPQFAQLRLGGLPNGSPGPSSVAACCVSTPSIRPSLMRTMRSPNL